MRDREEERERCEFGWLVCVVYQKQVWVFGQAGGGDHTVSGNFNYFPVADFGSL